MSLSECNFQENANQTNNGINRIDSDAKSIETNWLFVIQDTSYSCVIINGLQGQGAVPPEAVSCQCHRSMY